MLTGGVTSTPFSPLHPEKKMEIKKLERAPRALAVVHAGSSHRGSRDIVSYPETPPVTHSGSLRVSDRDAGAPFPQTAPLPLLLPCRRRPH